MSAQMQGMEFEGALLERGFWLYVWRIFTDDERTLHYIGKTGDKASGSNQSPFDRLSKHLGGNKHNNALRRHLGKIDVNPEKCRFSFHAFGPLYAGEAGTGHGDLCDVTSGLEKALADEMTAAGFEVINKVKHRGPIDRERFAPIWKAFSAQFPSVAAPYD